MKTLPANIVLEKNKVATPASWLILLEITLKDGTKYYLVKNNDDITFGGTPDGYETELEGYWNLDDNLATAVVLDETDNDRDGTLSDADGTPTTAAHSITGKVSTGLDFDGVDDYIDFSTISLTGAFSVGCWVKVDTLGEDDRIIHRGDGDSYGYSLRIVDSKFTFQSREHSETANAQADSTISTGTWYYVVGVYTGSAIKIYINGVLQSGTKTDDGEPDISGTDANLLMHLTMDDNAANSDVLDETANNNDGTFYSSEVESNTENHDIAGKLNNALDFAGTASDGDYIDMGAWTVPAAYTLACWVKVDSLTEEWMRIIQRGSGDGDGFSLRAYTDSGDLKLIWNSKGYDTSTNLKTTSAISTGVWYHVICTWDGVNQKFYLNNAIQTNTVSDNAGATGSTLNIGRRGAAHDQYFDGALDQILWYDKELSSGERAALYNSGNGVVNPIPDTPATSTKLQLARRAEIDDNYLDGKMDEVFLYSKALDLSDIEDLYNSGAGKAIPQESGSGQLYTSFNFTLEPTTFNSSGEITVLSLKVSNITKLIEPKLQELKGGMGSTVKITVINSELLEENYTELEMVFSVIGCSTSNQWVSFQLGAPSPLRQRYPLNKILALHCQWIYDDVECGYTHETIDGITLTSGNPVSINITSHPFITGNAVKFKEVGGTTELNGNGYNITKVDANNFTLDGTDGDDFTAWTSGGKAGFVLCKKTLADCRIHTNSPRFGGYPAMRSGTVRTA